LYQPTGRAATVVACDKTVCMALGKNEFLNMLQRGASVIESVYAHNNAYDPLDSKDPLLINMMIARWKK
jgi:NADH:ubiquinone oxidoreductase subunit E